MSTKNPFDLYEHGSGGFIIFEKDGVHLALQLLALDKAMLKGDRGTLMELDFNTRSVHISGYELSEVFDHLLGGRVKLIRIGHYDECVVDEITIFED